MEGYFDFIVFSTILMVAHDNIIWRQYGLHAVQHAIRFSNEGNLGMAGSDRLYQPGSGAVLRGGI